MKIVIAPDSYKESLSALEVATQIERGFQEIFPDAQYVKVPMADGGEGTVQAMVEATQGRHIEVEVTAPLGERVTGFYGLTGDGRTAMIEMAAASGLALVPPARRDPRVTTSYGTGELITAALDAGARHLILGIGGSATNDGGAGMLQALGVQLLDAQGLQLGRGGAPLAQLDRIDASGLDVRLAECTIEVACDVDNPLTGPRGASAIFGPQKGATPEVVQQLDANLQHFARIILRDVGADVDAVAGAGAAGGMGAAMLAFLKGQLRPGCEIIAKAVGLEAAVKDADLVVTGEGRIDQQTIFGKTPFGVATVAKQFGKPVVGIAGGLGTNAHVVHDHGIDAIFSVLSRICTIEDALAEAEHNVRSAARNIAAVLAMGQGLRAGA
ncbi:glycerate kinase [Comamonas terrigena]|uniref:Glycerate kinase n=1 Tax=Comamonas terrigena TaxID=32013 RepID=A0A2A7UYJ7_COMTR|nr:glycerate kinase [Comamonas terrigena]PEH90261.1 glycerate kinase [Comamonas terrigena]BBL25597.1 glycerate 2-kinase [Comamonas terrigena NBRC 13299]SUY70835.1 Glycerate kinase [Comamonas terrigena]